METKLLSDNLRYSKIILRYHKIFSYLLRITLMSVTKSLTIICRNTILIVGSIVSLACIFVLFLSLLAVCHLFPIKEKREGDAANKSRSIFLCWGVILLTLKKGETYSSFPKGLLYHLKLPYFRSYSNS